MWFSVFWVGVYGSPGVEEVLDVQDPLHVRETALFRGTRLAREREGGRGIRERESERAREKREREREGEKRERERERGKERKKETPRPRNPALSRRKRRQMRTRHPRWEPALFRGDRRDISGQDTLT